MLPPEERLREAHLHRYVRDELYWTLHAPRQTGKTTFLLSWARELNATGAVAACYVTVEECQPFENPVQAIPTACACVPFWAERFNLPVPKTEETNPGKQLGSLLANWAAAIPDKPLVVLFDEVDVLSGEALVSFLRQLRSGFAGRGPGAFPVSIALVGMRDLRDYLTRAKDGIPVNPGSPFNIKQDSASIGNFSRANISSLFSQRTAEIGQKITQDALEYVWEQSGGQPWIVNSLFMRATMQVLDEDSTETVTVEHLAAARKMMISTRETHLDALGKRLADPHVRKVIQSILVGGSAPLSRDDDDVNFVMDLGLVKWSKDENFQIANPIYSEILTRYLNGAYHDSAPPLADSKWQRADGSLDMDALMREFQKFWRLHSEIWADSTEYTEAFPHLLLMAFLQRITNGGSRIERECASGRGRMDLLVEYEDKKYIIEIKLLRDNTTLSAVLEKGLEQVREYRDRIDKTTPCYLVVFDRRSPENLPPWEKRIYWKNESDVTIVGC